MSWGIGVMLAESVKVLVSQELMGVACVFLFVTKHNL